MSTYDRDTLQAHRLECIPKDESDYIRKIGELLRNKVSSSYPPGKTLRDAHPKQHGTVLGRFIVHDLQDSELKHGIFKEAGEYKAFIRFSNANPSVGSDMRKDVRGMAIKLLDVKGKKLAEGEEDCSTFDFVTISYDVFLTKDVEEMFYFTKAFFNGMLNALWFMFNPFNSHLRVFWNFITSSQRATSPLDIQYYSMTPYLLGEKAVKYSAKPQQHKLAKIPNPPVENFLRIALRDQLLEGPMEFDFMVQRQTDPAKMPIEDSGKRWSQKLSPFIKVASIIIPKQEFETAERMEYGDNLSFTPWRCLAENRPLGGINRCRKFAYRAISLFRHDQNATKREEPTSKDYELFKENKIRLPEA